MKAIRILLVEDDDQQRQLIDSILSGEQHHVISAASVEEAIVLLKSNTFDVVFSDWKLGQLSGIDLLNYVRKNQPQLGFAIATAYGTISHAVEAMKAGADDYLAKPFQRQALLITIDKSFNASQLRATNNKLTEALSHQDSLVELIGNAPCMQQVFERIKRVSATNATILIYGESGTGKELAARALHNCSNRSGKFIAINCGAIPEALAEAELFGAKKGAYTGADSDKIGKIAAADGGTLLLDEIGELPLSLQAKLLRFIQQGSITPLGCVEEQQVDVRIVAATHRNLEQMVRDGEFREDLYYRLNVVPLTMPPLRERKEDIPRLIEHFTTLNAKRYQCQPSKLSSDVLKALLDYHWAGNVRELANRIERFVLLDDQQELLQGLNSSPNANSSIFTLPSEGLNWEAFEKQCLSDALKQNHGNKTQAAKFLQLGYKAILYRLDMYQLT